MDKEQLLLEVEDLLRTMPPRPTIWDETPENHAWWGRAAALVTAWSLPHQIQFQSNYTRIVGDNARLASPALRENLTLLHQMRSDLLLQVRGPLSTVVGAGMVFDYFDEVRKIIEPARQDLLFVDPYLDAEFVSRYLPHVAQGVLIRLLCRERLSTLLPAVAAFAQQSGAQLEVRSADKFHDRYVLVDGAACYQSGASFKDGGRTAPTTLTQITDAFAAVQVTYENLWAAGKVHR